MSHDPYAIRSEGSHEEYAPVDIFLEDDLGADALVVLDEAGDVVFKIDSAGNVWYKGLLLHVDTIEE